MTKQYGYTEALRIGGQPVERLTSPACFSIGATANSIAVPILTVGTSNTGRKPFFVLITPEVTARWQFNAVANASESGVLYADQTQRFFLHSDVAFITAIKSSSDGVAHLTWLY